MSQPNHNAVYTGKNRMSLQAPSILRLLRGSIITAGRSTRSAFRLFRPVTKLVIEGFLGQSQDIVESNPIGGTEHRRLVFMTFHGRSGGSPDAALGI